MNIEETRDEKSKSVVVYTRFCLDKNNNKDCLFCFYEGEDRKYYNSRIEKYSDYDFEHIISYDCGGKENVLNIYKLIGTSEKNNEIKKAFFIDRDFIPSPLKKEEIYETPCYSIENFYVSASAFGKILVREFGINCNDQDYEKCIQDYKSRINEYNNLILYFNAWLSCQRKKGKDCFKVKLSDFKIMRYFNNVSINKVEVKKIIDDAFLREYFKDADYVVAEEVEEEKKLFNEKDRSSLFRGKFELDFLKSVLKSLVELNKKQQYFAQKYNSVSLNPDTNILSTLCEYADTPDCLIKFLNQYRK